MKLVMVGTGYVGLVSGTCFSEFGFDVVCVDKNPKKIEMLNDGIMPIFEKNLETLVEQNVRAGRLSFTTNLESSLKDADAVFIAVGTPPRAEDGHADLKYIYEAAKEISEKIDGYTVLVTKSTVPVGTAREIESIVIKYKKTDSEIDVCSNPEFLREGAAIDDFMNPDRVVIGTDSSKAQKVLEKIYEPLSDKQIPILVTRPETSEIIKYAANAFLATKITFINEIADLCEASGGDVMDVAKGIGLDSRIGTRFLNTSPGYGGSCFPKDTLALSQTGKLMKAPQTVVEAVIKANTARQVRMAQKIISACGGVLKNKTVGVLGAAFKADTDDVRDAPSLIIIPILQDAGAKVVIHDPQAQHESHAHITNVEWKENSYDVAEGVDALVLMTNWQVYKELDMDKIAELMNEKILIDLHNIYAVDEMEKIGFDYTSIGRPKMKAQS